MSEHSVTGGWQQLTDVLGDNPPQGLEELDSDQLTQLAKLIMDARQQQQARLKQSLERALRHVPALARGTVRRVLFPEGLS